MKPVLITATLFLLTGCFATANDLTEPQKPDAWTAHNSENVVLVETAGLKNWWEKFDDPALNRLVELTLSSSPDRGIAKARIMEARGLQRTARSSLFPQIGASAESGREDTSQSDTDDFYDARFDASFELDVFGRNRKTSNAAAARVAALEANYHNTTLTLIADVARAYIDYRGFKKQESIARKNLDIQEQTLKLITVQRDLGEAPQLDVERAENLVNTTKSSIPEFQRLADNARLQLTVLTGKLPSELMSFLDSPMGIPGANVQPLLMAPSDILAQRPDIRAAASDLEATTSLAEAATANLFPTFTLGGFFGVTENALVNSTTIWNVALGAAVSLIDFGRIEGEIDAARALELQAYEAYRLTILQAVTEVETALTDYARINDQRISLQKAFDNADHALTLSQNLYKEGEISFIDILDAQRTVNEADSALVTAEAAQANSLIRLYKSLGVY